MPVDFKKFAFTAGELSPSLYGRGDLEGFEFGYREGLNVLVDWRGGLKTRPGTELCEPLFESKEFPGVRLSSFSFNTDPEDNYLIIWLHRALRFIQNGNYLTTGLRENPAAKTTGTLVRVFDGLDRYRFTGRLVSVGAGNNAATALVGYKNQSVEIPVNYRVEEVYSLGTVYPADVLRELRFEQFRDDIIITHREYPPSVLRRSLSPSGPEFNIVPQTFLSARHVSNKRSAVTARTNPLADSTGGFQWTVGIVDKEGNEHPVNFDDGAVESDVNIGENVLTLSWSNDELAEHYRIYASAFKPEFNEPLSIILAPVLTGERSGSQGAGFIDALEWTAITGATSYEISFGTWTEGSGSTVSSWSDWSDWARQTTLTHIRSVDGEVRHRYRVRSAVGAIFGPISDVLELGVVIVRPTPSFDPNLGIPILSGSQDEGTEQGSYTDVLAWSPVIDATSYEIRYRVHTGAWGNWSDWIAVTQLSYVQTFVNTVNRRREWEVRASTSSTYSGISNRVELGVVAPIPVVVTPLVIEAGIIDSDTSFEQEFDLLLNGREVFVNFTVTERLDIQTVSEIITAQGGGYYFEYQSSMGISVGGPYHIPAAVSVSTDSIVLNAGDYRLRYYIHEVATIATTISLILREVESAAPPVVVVPESLQINYGVLNSNKAGSRIIPPEETLVFFYEVEGLQSERYPIRFEFNNIVGIADETLTIRYFIVEVDGDGSFTPLGSTTFTVADGYNALIYHRPTHRRVTLRNNGTEPVTVYFLLTFGEAIVLPPPVITPLTIAGGTIDTDNDFTDTADLLLNGRNVFVNFTVAEETTIQTVTTINTPNSGGYYIEYQTRLGAAIRGPTHVTAATETLIDTITLPDGDYRLRYYIHPSSTIDIEIGFTLSSFEDVTGPISLPVSTLLAHAGEDRRVESSEVVYLTGSASLGSGSYINYAWEKTAGLAVDLVDIRTGVVAFLAPRDDAEQVYTFQLTVNDSVGAAQTDDVTITVSARAATIIQSGKGPSTSLPENNDGYAFCLEEPVFGPPWGNRVGRVFTWSNAEAGTFASGVAFTEIEILGPLSDEHLLWFQSALHRWEDIGNFTFTKVDDAEDVNLRTGYTIFDKDNVIASARGALRPQDTGVFIGFRETLFDTYRTRVPEHEVGHHLGLWHPIGEYTETIMETPFSSIPGTRVDPTLGDMVGVWHLYGPSSRAPNTAPDAVADFEVVHGIRRHDLSWAAPAITGGTPVSSYTLYRMNDTGVVTTVTLTSKTYAHIGLGEHETWLYWIVANNSSGAGLPSARVRSYTRNDEGEVVGPQEITFSWLDPSIFISESTDRIVFRQPSTVLPYTWILSLQAAHLVSFQIVRSSGRMSIGLSLDATSLIGSDPGPFILPEVIPHLQIVLISGADTITIPGISDPTEPYAWVPFNSAALIEWASRRNSGDAVTISLTYEAP